MALIWTEPENITANGLEERAPAVAIAPDRSVYVLYIRDTVGSKGLFLKRRTRDKEWLDEIRVDTIALDTTHNVSAETFAIEPNGFLPILRVLKNGDVHIAWTQKGYGTAVGFASILYRRMIYTEGEDYPVSQEKILVRNPTSNDAQSMDFDVDANGDAWFISNNGNDIDITYVSSNDAGGATIPADTTRIFQPVTYNDSGTQVNAKAQCALSCANDGSCHAAWVATPDEEINYVSRALSDASPLWGDTKVVVEGLASAGDNRAQPSIFARNLNDVYVFYELQLTTSDRVQSLRSRESGQYWTDIRLDDASVSVDADPGSVTGFQTKNRTLAIHSLNTADADNQGLWYSLEQDDGTWEIERAVQVNTATDGISQSRVSARVYPNSPFTLGYLNPRVGQAVAAYLRRG